MLTVSVYSYVLILIGYDNYGGGSYDGGYLGWRKGQKNNGNSSTASPVLDANVVPAAAQVQPVAAPASLETSFDDAEDKISFE